MIKYGVVGIEAAIRDLRAWDSLLVAGRLHKPVSHIVKDTAVMDAIDGNLQAALAAALLMLPASFTTLVLCVSGRMHACLSQNARHIALDWLRRSSLRACAASPTWGMFAWALLRINTRFGA